MTEEEAKTKWLPVAGFEGLYEVSEDGRVRSVDRMKPYRRASRFAKGRVIRPTVVDGYPRVPLWRGNRPTWVFVHRLVAIAFVGPAPSEVHQVNHKDGDRARAHASNLEWVTASENQRHSYRELGRKPAGGRVCGPANGRYIDGRRSQMAGQP